MAAYTTIDDPSAYFKVQLYTGTGSSNAQTFADTDTDMQPDMVWIKSRSDGFNHMLYDAARGVQKHIKPDTTAAEATDSNSLTAFGSDGFTVGSNSDLNNSSDTYVAWCWNTQGGAGSSNEAGTINSTTTLQISARQLHRPCAQLEAPGPFSLLQLEAACVAAARRRLARDHGADQHRGCPVDEEVVV